MESWNNGTMAFKQERIPHDNARFTNIPSFVFFIPQEIIKSGSSPIYSERQKKVVIACAAFSREIPPSPLY
jgi:hypothetical protein